MRGVSPTIMAVILALIAIATAGVLYVWFPEIQSRAEAESKQSMIIPEVSPKLSQIVCFDSYAYMVLMNTQGQRLVGSLPYLIERDGAIVSQGYLDADINESGRIYFPGPLDTGKRYKLSVTAGHWSISGYCDSREDPTLALWLPFSEGAGIVALDTSGNRNHATVNADWVNGTTDNALRFNGSSGYAVVQDANILRPDSFTLDFWTIRETSDADSETLLSKTDGTDGWDFVSNTNDTLSFRTFSSGTTDSVSMTISEEEWVKVYALYNSTHLLLYNNCTLEDYAAGSFSPSSVKLFIGNGSADYNGAIDELRIYGRALLPAELDSACKTGTIKDGAYNGTWGPG
ncbi:MAG: LamG domain-containing protein, partial [Candidatus Altiarchaeota archaeon]|nr:LamG domain-containing protein [Candidatus Altiarchaeota archaeon]